MEISLAILLCVICFGIGTLLGQHQANNKHYKEQKQEELKKDEEIKSNNLLKQREQERKDEDLENIKKALINLSLRHSKHHCEGVYAMLKSKHFIVEEGKMLEKQIYNLLIKEKTSET
ncbi:MAG: hypothetical protein IJZ29_01200 [Clostridia bacterium]|nr:hypothetical protein [Clostridia bacterium]